MVAALYITYGPLITMVYSAGKGAHEFVLNREGEYVLSQENIRLNEQGSIYSLGGLRKEWTDGHRRFVEFLEDQGYKLRYSGGFVPDINQVLIKKGGVFTYPALKKNPRGKLRLLFELQPMAFISEWLSTIPVSFRCNEAVTLICGSSSRDSDLSSSTTFSTPLSPA